MKNIVKLTLITALLITSLVSFGQSSSSSKGSLDEGTLKSQFDYMLRVSTNYQGHKVIKKTSIDKFYGNFSDSLSTSYSNNRNLKSMVDRQQSTIDSLNNKMGLVQGDFEKVTKEKNSFSLFGILMNKNAYNTLLWGLILGLIGALSFFVVRFKNSNSHTVKARTSYEKTKSEFDSFKQKTLEKEQVLMRKLQDEINKNLAG